MDEYQKFLPAAAASASDEKLAKLMAYHHLRLSEFQHERLIHLLVTLTVALCTVILLGLTLITKEIWLAVVSAVLMILLVFYLLHYRKLENELQKLYKISEAVFSPKFG